MQSGFSSLFRREPTTHMPAHVAPAEYPRSPRATGARRHDAHDGLAGSAGARLESRLKRVSRFWRTPTAIPTRARAILRADLRSLAGNTPTWAWSEVFRQNAPAK